MIFIDQRLDLKNDQRSKLSKQPQQHGGIKENAGAAL